MNIIPFIQLKHEHYSGKAIQNIPQTKLNPNLCTKDQLIQLDFGHWADNLFLIPFWLLPCISDTFIGRSINDKEGDVRELITADIDKDVRYGCIAFGVEPKE
jgi:hypothetical protein